MGIHSPASAGHTRTCRVSLTQSSLPPTPPPSNSSHPSLKKKLTSHKARRLARPEVSQLRSHAIRQGEKLTGCDSGTRQDRGTSPTANSIQWFTTYFLQEAGAGKRCSECGPTAVGALLSLQFPLLSMRSEKPINVLHPVSQKFAQRCL